MSQQTPSRPTLKPELMAVVALLVLAGGILSVLVLTDLPDVLEAFGQGELGRAFGSLALAILFVVGGVAVACFALARMVFEGDRVGRILTVTLAGAVVLGWLTADYRAGGDTVVMLCAVAIAGILTVARAAREHFAAGDVAGREPAPVVAARSLVVVLAWVFGIVGVAFLPVGAALEGKYVVAGIGIVAVSAFAYATSKKIATRDPQARLVITVLMGLYVVLMAIAGEASDDLFIPVAVAVAAAGLLWIPEESQRFFTPPQAQP